MKKIQIFLSVLTMSAALTACTTPSDLFGLGGGRGVNVDSNQGDRPYRLSNTHWTDVANIRNRANELSMRVGRGELTKVQAAQLLNDYRIKLVGHNSVDDSVYAVYLRAATQSQSGHISTEQSKRLIQNSLSGWSQRWPNMRSKPTNPAFTNFLNEVMGVSPLM